MKMLEDLEEVVRNDHEKCPNFWAAIEFIRTHHATIRDMAARLKAAEKNNEKNIAYLKEHVPCTCSYSGSCGQRSDGTYYGESKITWKCQRCRYIDTMQETGR